jgi:hypothetical protein
VSSYPSSMQVSNRCMIMLSDAFRHRRNTPRTRWRRVAPGRSDVRAHAEQCACSRTTGGLTKKDWTAADIEVIDY